MTPTGRFLIMEFDHLPLKEKVEVLNIIVRDYKGMVAFAELSEIEKKLWAHNFTQLAREYFEDPEVTK